MVLRAVTPGVTLVAFLGRGGQQEWAVKHQAPETPARYKSNENME